MPVIEAYGTTWNIRWMWSLVPPIHRWFMKGSDGSIKVATDYDVIWCFLMKEYERQIREELLDSEWK